MTTDELARGGYRANEGDRCYHCKSELLDTVVPVAKGHGMAVVATGTNADDLLAGFRPGIAAAAERGAVTPLADAGLSKRAIRTLSKQWGLATWAKPAAACLSSRVAFGIEITPGEAGPGRPRRVGTAVCTARRRHPRTKSPGTRPG